MSQGRRRLAAIMFTDMVGYSAMVQRDEDLALELLEEHRRILRPLIAQYAGEVIDTIGDGFLIEFASALQAVRFAIEAQRALRDRNASSNPDREIRIRIGIHVGDVVFGDGSLYGDGVNIAARIEPFSEAGGICISQQVYDQVHTKIDVAFATMGRPLLKNIGTPIEIYRVVLPWQAKGPAAQIPAQAAAHAAGTPRTAAPDKRSVAVLPLANLSADPENEYFSDGLTEDILTHLSRIRHLKVISRTSVMQYKKTTKNLREIGKDLGVAAILEGTVRKAGNKVRINVQLIDAGTDEHLWAEAYDRELADIFAIQSDVAGRIADALNAHVSADERARIEHRPTDSLEAYHEYLKGRFLWNQRTKESVNAAIERFKRAVEIDHAYAPAYVGLADSYIVLGNYGTYRPLDIAPPAKAAALKAIEIDKGLGEAYASLANIQQNHEWDWAAGEKSFLKAIELTPGSANAHHWYALYLNVFGRFDQARIEIQRAQELDPLAPMIACNATTPYLISRRYDEGLRVIDRVIERHPGFPTAHMYRGWVLILMGAYADALPPLLKAVTLSTEADVVVRAALGVAYAKTGERAKSKTIADALAERYRQSYASAVWIGFLHMGLGDEHSALEWLEKAHEDHDSWVRALKYAFFDEIRALPRFQTILAKLGLADP
jgi:TolB-like protein/class 3 adenylate cyclase/Flp pilus assembly protein TadD